MRIGTWNVDARSRGCAGYVGSARLRAYSRLLGRQVVVRSRVALPAVELVLVMLEYELEGLATVRGEGMGCVCRC